MVDHKIPLSYNGSITINKEFRMESNTIIVLIALAYGAFMGYCLGRAQGYYKGAQMAESIYRK
jgi:hypothetical protein